MEEKELQTTEKAVKAKKKIEPKVICINGQQEMSEQGLDSFIDLKNTLLKTL